MEKLNLQNGQTVDLVDDQGVFRVTIDNQHFCSESKDQLLDYVGKVYPIVTLQPIEIDNCTHFENMQKILRNRLSSLDSKQNALAHIRLYKDSAEKVLHVLSTRPPLSQEAQNLTKMLGKGDFVEITHFELVKYVSDLVLRAQLVDELVLRLDFKGLI